MWNILTGSQASTCAKMGTSMFFHSQPIEYVNRKDFCLRLLRFCIKEQLFNTKHDKYSQRFDYSSGPIADLHVVVI